MSIELKEMVTCPQCGKDSEFIVWNSLNGDIDPDAKQQLLGGTLFVFECPHCGHSTNLVYPILYHDMKNQTMVYFTGKESVERAKMAFNDTVNKIGFSLSNHRMRIVTDQNALREKAIIFENELDDRVIEIIKLLYFANVQKQCPSVHITDAYFLIANGKYLIQLIGERDLSAEFNRDLYKKIQAQFVAPLASDNEMCIDMDWAQQVLTRE